MLVRGYSSLTLTLWGERGGVVHSLWVHFPAPFSRPGERILWESGLVFPCLSILSQQPQNHAFSVQSEFLGIEQKASVRLTAAGEGSTGGTEDLKGFISSSLWPVLCFCAVWNLLPYHKRKQKSSLKLHRDPGGSLSS